MQGLIFSAIDGSITQGHLDSYRSTLPDVGEIYMLQGNFWNKKDMDSLLYLFAMFEDTQEGHLVFMKWKDEYFYHTLYKAGICIRSGCSRIILAKSFWDLRRDFAQAKEKFLLYKKDVIL